MAMTLRLPDELNEALKRRADVEHTSVHGLVIKASEEYLARHGKQVLIDDAVDMIKVDFADALRRLGE